MKTRDELAEAFAMRLAPRISAYVSMGHEDGIDVGVAEAFDLADAFVAVRARRAVPTPDARGECCCYSGCEGDTAIHQHADEPCPVHPDRPLARGRAPLREEVAAPAADLATPPAPDALRFSDAGTLLDANGAASLVGVDGFGGTVGEGIATVHLRATSRAHAERMVAAMLAAGRAVDA